MTKQDAICIPYFGFHIDRFILKMKWGRVGLAKDTVYGADLIMDLGYLIWNWVGLISVKATDWFNSEMVFLFRNFLKLYFKNSFYFLFFFYYFNFVNFKKKKKNWLYFFFYNLGNVDHNIYLKSQNHQNVSCLSDIYIIHFALKSVGNVWTCNAWFLVQMHKDIK